MSRLNNCCTAPSTKWAIPTKKHANNSKTANPQQESQMPPKQENQPHHHWSQQKESPASATYWTSLQISSTSEMDQRLAKQESHLGNHNEPSARSTRPSTTPHQTMCQKSDWGHRMSLHFQKMSGNSICAMIIACQSPCKSTAIAVFLWSTFTE